ncbi:hypothetical protein PR202_ga04173 [Eleusine coracana subsp. coracana]|uniref:Protein LURP-one-related 8 n=1 Tax=Eleusine coracana subsp. coracana TaxID=191504 RepID=A0AAV5BPM8_ELECO|nr:hypothetical protein QOZ80_5AG0379420 [Eleusine coracana subsp. coracana]GJM88146.1 hypothetical protein PR202_ga04173 [Eleusine coracana subsp. coracana]
MAKVHPNSVDVSPPTTTEHEEEEPPPATVLTVWRKSLLFNCDGFTVFDANGDLAFRVDSYGIPGRRRAEVVLMDVAGKPLLTVRRKKRLLLGGLTEHWLIYDGDAAADDDEGTTKRPILSVRRHVSLRSSSGKKALAHVTPIGVVSGEAYVVEGSYGRRACRVRDAGNRDAVVAEVRRRKECLSVGDDVFRLVVADPRRMGAPLAMGLVIALDEMFSSSSSGSLLRRTWSA